VAAAVYGCARKNREEERKRWGERDRDEEERERAASASLSPLEQRCGGVNLLARIDDARSSSELLPLRGRRQGRGKMGWAELAAGLLAVAHGRPIEEKLDGLRPKTEREEKLISFLFF
jgi:hypothetical protein